MVYFDTSFIIPRYITEATSSKVEAVLIGLSEQLTISQWTRIELTESNLLTHSENPKIFKFLIQTF